MTGTEFNRIMRICTPALSNDSIRQCLQCIAIESNGEGEGCAIACDGFTMAQTRFSCKGTKGRFLIRPFKTMRNDCEITITKNGEEVSVTDGVETVTRKEPASGYIDHYKICADAQGHKKRATIAFDSRLLAKAMKSHTKARETVFLEIYGPTDPVIIHSSQACGLVLPMRVNGEHEEPEFWHMEDEKK